MSEKEAYRQFVRTLDIDLLRHLEVERVSRRSSGQVFGWRHVVASCREMAAGCTLVQKTKTGGSKGGGVQRSSGGV